MKEISSKEPKVKPRKIHQKESWLLTGKDLLGFGIAYRTEPGS